MKIIRKPRNVVIRRPVPQVKSSHSKKLGYGKYVLPYDENIPAGMYYSKVVHIEETTTRAGKLAKVIFYNISVFSEVYQKINGLMPDDKPLKILFIKQVYPIDSDPYRVFLESMYNALEIDYEDDVEETEFIGITEVISIGYTSKTGVGGINKRNPWCAEDFIYLYEQNTQPIPTADEYCDVEYDEYGNVI